MLSQCLIHQAGSATNQLYTMVARLQRLNALFIRRVVQQYYYSYSWHVRVSMPYSSGGQCNSSAIQGNLPYLVSMPYSSGGQCNKQEVITKCKFTSLNALFIRRVVQRKNLSQSNCIKVSMPYSSGGQCNVHFRKMEQVAKSQCLIHQAGSATLLYVFCLLALVSMPYSSGGQCNPNDIFFTIKISGLQCLKIVYFLNKKVNPLYTLFSIRSQADN